MKQVHPCGVNLSIETVREEEELRAWSSRELVRIIPAGLKISDTTLGCGFLTYSRLVLTGDSVDIAEWLHLGFVYGGYR